MQFSFEAGKTSRGLVIRPIVGEVEHFTKDGDQVILELAMSAESWKKLSLRTVRLLIRKAVQMAKAGRYGEIAFFLPDWERLTLTDGKLSESDWAALITTNVLMAEYTFVRYKTPPQEGFPRMKRVTFIGVKTITAVRSATKQAEIIAIETNAARSIANEPAGEMTPAHLVAHAKKVLRPFPIKVTVFDEQRLAKEKMEGILAVGRGSDAKPRFIIAEYRAAKKSEAPIVLVGKGVTFDSGGINLKPSDAILGMNMDMSGAATVLHVLAACARLKVKKNIIALIPAVENMISGRSYRPGDIIRTASGKTIEVQNTDAEGRIILAEALCYAKRYAPELVIDVATLTGAAMVALGERASAVFTEDEQLESTLRHIGMRVGDPVWPLPLWDEYLEDIKGTYADIGNVGNTKWGGAITAALFLKQFVDYPWVHLDIAPRMVATAGENLAKGSIGAGVQLLTHFLLEKNMHD